MKKVGAVALLLGAEAALLSLLILFLTVESTAWLLLLLLTAGAVIYLGVKKPQMKASAAHLLAENKKMALAGLMVLVLIFPLVMRSSPYWIFIMIMVGLMIIVGLGLNIEIGSAGMVNLAGAAFYAIGAYTSALLALRAGWPALLSIPAGAAAASVAGVGLFLPIMKTRGHYLSLVTIAFGLIINILLDNMEWTGGPQGLKCIPGISLGGYEFTSHLHWGGIEVPFYANYLYLVFIVAGGAILVSSRLYNSWTGLVWAGIRDDALAAQCSGLRPERFRLAALIIGNFLIGLAGAIYAHVIRFISPPSFTFADSLVMVSIVILGGLDNVAGVVLGAALLVILPEKLRITHDYHFLIYGLIIIVMVTFRPRGLLPARIRDYGLPQRKR